MSYGKVWESKNAEYLAEATERLHELFPAGSEVTTVVTHVTRSGMGRTIKVLGNRRGPDGHMRITNVSGDVARVLGWQIDRQTGDVYVQGCGMDMCFHLVYSLARTLYGDWAMDLLPGTRDAGYSLTSRTI